MRENKGLILLIFNGFLEYIDILFQPETLEVILRFSQIILAVISIIYFCIKIKKEKL